MKDTKRTILYVDDEQPNRFLFQLTFRDELDVLTAASGSEGLEMLDKHNEIDVVISDMKMPGMSGLEFITIAKQKGCEIPCYLLTGFTESDEIDEAVDQNIISYYFKKPFIKDEILDKVSC